MLDRRTLLKAIPFLGASFGGTAKSEVWQCSIPEGEPITVQPQYADPLLGYRFPMMFLFRHHDDGMSALAVNGKVNSRTTEGRYRYSGSLLMEDQSGLAGTRLVSVMARFPMTTTDREVLQYQSIIPDGKSDITVAGEFYFL